MWVHTDRHSHETFMRKGLQREVSAVQTKLHSMHTFQICESHQSPLCKHSVNIIRGQWHLKGDFCSSWIAPEVLQNAGLCSMDLANGSHMLRIGLPTAARDGAVIVMGISMPTKIHAPLRPSPHDASSMDSTR